MNTFTTSKHVDPAKVISVCPEDIIEAVCRSGYMFSISGGPDKEKEFFEMILSDQETEDILTEKDIYDEIEQIFLKKHNKDMEQKEALKNTRKEELKTCPFCGAEAEFNIYINDSPGRKKMGVYLCSVGVQCSKCGMAKFSPSSVHVEIDCIYKTIEKMKDDAIKHWNKRS